MKYVCDAPRARTWFRIETEEEACQESALMRHSMATRFRLEMDKARHSFRPASTVFVEAEIGLRAHLLREMPMFLTLRDADGAPLATAMLPQTVCQSSVRSIILGKNNLDPYMTYADAIVALGKHLGRTLERARCYPYPPGRH
jgi:hypothetical protein